MRVISASNRCSRAGILFQRVGIATQWVAIHYGVGRIPACDPRAGGDVMRYKTWRSRKDTHLHLLCAEGSEPFESLPVAIRNLGPWQGIALPMLSPMLFPVLGTMPEKLFVKLP